MGRPKKGAKPKAEDRSPEDRPTVINLKGTNEYIDWIDDLHRRTHIPKATIVRLALAEWAERHGHPAPPEL